jgi:hypothetical protein
MSNILPRSIAPALTSVLLAPQMLSVLRIVAGLAFFEHGTGKLLGFPARLPFIDKMPTGLLYFTGTMAARSSCSACSRARWRSFCPASWPLPISWRTSR